VQTLVETGYRILGAIGKVEAAIASLLIPGPEELVVAGAVRGAGAARRAAVADRLVDATICYDG
jgi:hypothetical protein